MGEGGRKKMRVLLLALGLSALCLVAHGASPDHEFNEVDQMREVDEVIPQDPMRDDNDTSEPITTKIVLGKFSDPSGPITTKIGPSNQDPRYVNGRPVTSNELDRPVKLSSSSSVTQQAGYLFGVRLQERRQQRRRRLQERRSLQQRRRQQQSVVGPKGGGIR